MITASTLRFTDAAALKAFVSSDSDVPPRPQLPDLLSTPALTGMSRSALQALIEQVTGHIAARNERHHHRRRGGERLPGARGGVFTQKITDVERVLATILYSRKIATQDTLAELFEVSRSTIRNVVREVLPLLEQTNYTPTPSGARFATAAELLAFLTTDTATPPT